MISAGVLFLMLATSVEAPEAPDVAPKSFVIVKSKLWPLGKLSVMG